MSDATSPSTTLSITTSSVLPQSVIINTRPIERAVPLTQSLQAAGLLVVEMPMLALHPRTMTDKDRQIMRQALAGEYKALVVVSPTAAALGAAAWRALVAASQQSPPLIAPAGAACAASPMLSHLIAVGDATAAALNDAKMPVAGHPVRQPTIANNEGMLAMPEIERLQAGDRLLIWRGLGGRRLLVDALQRRGVHIDSIAWYERKMPAAAKTQYQQWLQEFLMHQPAQDKAQSALAKPIVVISSGAAFAHWERVVIASAQPYLSTDGDKMTTRRPPLELTDFVFVVLGARLANIMAARQLDHWRVEDLAPATILATIHAKTS